AAQFLGAPEREWMIADYNEVERADPGRLLVVPLKWPNPLGVHADAYQTVPILAYHRFGTGGGRMVVTPAHFEAQLAWLARHGYHVLPLRALADFLAGRQPLPRRSVVITIDDGYESAHRYALPLLRKYGFPATVFVYTDFVGGGGDALSWNQLHELAASGLVDIQAHSKSHRNLLERGAAESDQQYRQGLEAEVRTPREVLERRLAHPVRHYAFPYGDANELVLDLLASQRYELAVTVNPGGNGFFAQPLMLRRTMIFGDHGLDAFQARLQTSRPILAPATALACAKLAAAGAASFCGMEPLPPLAVDDGAGPVLAFEHALRERALLQMQQGRLAEAAQAWEVLVALRPHSADYRARLARTREQIAELVPERLRLAQAALRRGDSEGASMQFLAVLALQPEHAQAADALRAIERERVRRQHLGKFSRYTLERRPPAPPSAPATTSSPSP
ncbi:MAG TPA: polysaccharide deacetylase family protein, partial [Ramlibacter sp.]|uniref:polysaccharide deacetylase family protein n=1 Tax=Ramlibacter sp. TaxID=1917967 RepID=UPI002D7E52D6